MSNDHKTILAEGFRDVIEKIAFMFAEPVPRDDLVPAESACLRATIRFDGPERSGTVSIAAPMGLCIEVAANVLGLDAGERVGVGEASDALRELVNVLCGRFLTDLAGDEPVFNLSIPEVLQLDQTSWDELVKSGEALTFVVDDTAPMIVAGTVNGSEK